jgi:hypothetical protein
MSVKFKIGLVFSLIGTPIFAGGLFWAYNSAMYSMSAVQVSGSIIQSVQDVCSRTENNRSVNYTCYQPVVQYQHAGQSYKLSLSERSSSQYTIGEKIELKVDPKNPGEASTNSGLWLGPIFLTIFGSLFGGIGLLILRSHFRRKKLESELLATGASIRALVIEIGPNRSVSVNGVHPFMIRAQFNDPNTNLTVVAELAELWHDPVHAGEIAEDNTVEVLYDRKDSKRCMIVLGKTKKIKAA